MLSPVDMYTKCTDDIWDLLVNELVEWSNSPLDTEPLNPSYALIEFEDEDNDVIFSVIAYDSRPEHCHNEVSEYHFINMVRTYHDLRDKDKQFALDISNNKLPLNDYNNYLKNYRIKYHQRLIDLYSFVMKECYSIIGVYCEIENSRVYTDVLGQFRSPTLSIRERNFNNESFALFYPIFEDNKNMYVQFSSRDNYVTLKFVDGIWRLNARDGKGLLLPFTRNMLFKYLSQFLKEKSER